MSTLTRFPEADFIRSWKKWYWEQPLPVDCAAVVGLNDVAHLSVDQFVSKLREWRAMMEEHSQLHGHAIPNTLAVATLLYAPKFYWHEGNTIDPSGGLVQPEHQIAQADRRHQAVQQGGGSKRDGWLPNGGSEEVPGLASAQMGGVERVPHSAGR